MYMVRLRCVSNIYKHVLFVAQINEGAKSSMSVYCLLVSTLVHAQIDHVQKDAANVMEY